MAVAMAKIAFHGTAFGTVCNQTLRHQKPFEPLEPLTAARHALVARLAQT